MIFEVIEGVAVSVLLRGERVELMPGGPVVVRLSAQVPVIPGGGPGTSGVTAKVRADGTLVTASIPFVNNLLQE